jgi:hypothetical protein
MVAFSERIAEERLELKRFLRERLYRHYRVVRMTSKARRVCCENLFRHFTKICACCRMSIARLARALARARDGANGQGAGGCRLRRRNDRSGTPFLNMPGCTIPLPSPENGRAVPAGVRSRK